MGGCFRAEQFHYLCMPMQVKRFISFFLWFLLIAVSASAQSNAPSTSARESQGMTNEKRKEKEDLGRHYYRNNEYRKAVALYDQLYWEAPSHSNYLYYTYSLFALQNFEKAEKVIRHQVREYPNQVRYRVDLGYALRSMNETKKAERIYDKIIKDLPSNEMLIKQTANSFSARRENEYALQTYRKGQELFGDPLKFAVEIGQLYDRMGKYEQMFAAYLSVLVANHEQSQIVKYRIQNTLRDDPDNEKATYFKNALLKKVQANPDERVYGELLLWLAIQLRDFDMALIQTKALERRFNLRGNKTFELGKIAQSNNRFDVASEAFAFAMKEAKKESPLYYQALTGRLEARFEELTHRRKPSAEELKDLEFSYEETLNKLGTNKLTFPLVSNLAHLQAYYLQKAPQAKELLEKALNVSGIDEVSLAKTKMKLAGILLFNNEYWEATLLYSQVEKALPNEPVGHEAKYQNAMLSFFIGEFDWAKAKFDVLRSATSKLIANDAMDMAFLLQENLESDTLHQAMKWYAEGNLMLYQHKYDSAIALFDSVQARYPTHQLTDNVLFKKANMAEENFRLEEADSLYKEIYTNFSFGLLADNALMRSADILSEKLGQEKQAMNLYKKILTDYSGSIFVFEARKKFRKIREKHGQSQETPGSALSD